MSRKKKMILSLLFVLISMLSMNAHASAKFSVSTGTMKKGLARYSLTVPVNGSEQRFAFKASEIIGFKVKSMKYDSARKKETVKASVLVDRTVASVWTSATMVYKYSAGKWKLSSVSFKGSRLYKIKLKGKWTGTYIAGQGKTKTNITVNHVTADGYLDKGTFYFSAVPTNPSVPSGSYTLKGGYDVTTGEVVFAGNEWISRPSGYNMIEIHAHVDLVNKKIVSGSNSWCLDIKKRV